MVAARPVQDDFYRARLNDFTSEILGELADTWIRLFEPQPNYRGKKFVWWPETITFMSPRQMVKRAAYRDNLAKILDVFQAQQTHLTEPLNGKSSGFGKTLTCTICCH
ncbi:hypothetical protein ACMYSQ_012607 [Aspergillus niger]